MKVVLPLVGLAFFLYQFENSKILFRVDSHIMKHDETLPEVTSWILLPTLPSPLVEKTFRQSSANTAQTKQNHPHIPAGIFTKILTSKDTPSQRIKMPR